MTKDLESAGGGIIISIKCGNGSPYSIVVKHSRGISQYKESEVILYDDYLLSRVNRLNGIIKSM